MRDKAPAVRNDVSKKINSPIEFVGIFAKLNFLCENGANNIIPYGLNMSQSKCAIVPIASPAKKSGHG